MLSPKRYHLDIFGLGDIVARLEGNIELLALVDLKRGLGEDAEHGRQLVGRHLLYALKRQDEHVVAREDGLVGIPAAMNGGLTATHIGIVHQVVVQQGEVMIGLQSNGRHEDILGLRFPQVIGHEHEYRTDAFATQ